MLEGQIVRVENVPMSRSQLWPLFAALRRPFCQVPLRTACLLDKLLEHHSVHPQIQGTVKDGKKNSFNIGPLIVALIAFGLTLAGSGLSGNRWAATKNMSGAGFPTLTSGSVLPMTL